MLKKPWIQRFDHDIYFDLLFHAVVNFYRSGVFPAVPACIAVCGNFPLFHFCGNFPLFHFARLIMHARRLDNYQQCCISNEANVGDCSTYRSYRIISVRTNGARASYPASSFIDYNSHNYLA